MTGELNSEVGWRIGKMMEACVQMTATIELEERLKRLERTAPKQIQYQPTKISGDSGQIIDGDVDVIGDDRAE
jgi:hypothetical protein